MSKDDEKISDVARLRRLSVGDRRKILDRIMDHAFGGRLDAVYIRGRLIADVHLRGVAMSYVAESHATRHHVEVGRLARSLQDREDRARRSAEAVLAGCRTLKKLREAWPEAEQFAVGLSEPSPSSAPSVPVFLLNKQLGLATRSKR
jgi:hypothetical protein